MKSWFGLTGILCAALVAVFFVVGCSSDDDNPSNPGGPDTTAPAVSTVTALHSFAVEVAFSETVTLATAERVDNYKLMDAVMAAASSSRNDRDALGSPSAELPIVSVALYPDGRTVLLSTDQALNTTDYDLEVENISDVHGNKMEESSTTTFAGSDAVDDTPPTMTYADPGSGDNGVGTAQPVFVTFSEPMQPVTVYNAFSWMAGGDRVSFGMHQLSANSYVFRAVSPIELNSTYTINISSAAQDRASNSFAGATWNFRTSPSLDTTPPTLISSSPIDGATDVAVDTALKLEFSEAINPLSLEEIILTPTVDDGVVEWIDGGKTLLFTPDYDFSTNTQYALTMPKGSVKDLAGNPIAETISIRFTTGASFAGGSIAGTLTGDLFSVQASDPTGAVVVATTTNLFGRSEEEDDDTEIFGTGIVSADDTYLIDKLPDNIYYPFAILDSNGDGILDPERGDAFGVYGVDLRDMDDSADPVTITMGAAMTSVDFPLYDPSVIFGTIFYAGQTYVDQLTQFQFYVGAFDVNGFDPDNLPSADFDTEGGPIAMDPSYRIDELDDGLMAGTYYVGGFLDIGGDGDYNADVDPAGFYVNRDDGNLLPVMIENGVDAGGIDIYLEDPDTEMSRAMAVLWTTQDASSDEVSLKVRRARAAIRRALQGLNGK